MKRAHDEPDVFGARRPGPPGLTTHPPPPGIAGHAPPGHPPPGHPPGHPPPGHPPGHAPAFPHSVLQPAPPGGLAHSFEQMRETMPRPPFPAPHLSNPPG